MKSRCLGWALVAHGKCIVSKVPEVVLQMSCSISIRGITCLDSERIGYKPEWWGCLVTSSLSISFKVRSNEVLSQQDDALRCHRRAWGVGVGTPWIHQIICNSWPGRFFSIEESFKETIEESNLEDFRFCVVCLWKLLVGSDVIEGRAQEVRSPRGWWGSDCLTYVAWVVNLPIITAECNELLELGQLRYVSGSYYVQQIYIIYAYSYIYNIYIYRQWIICMYISLIYSFEHDKSQDFSGLFLFSPSAQG